MDEDYEPSRGGAGKSKKGETQMTEMFVRAYFAVRGANQALLTKVGLERGASMVEYALLVGLIAIVAIVTVTLLGGSIAGLFNTANNCVNSAANCP